MGNTVVRDKRRMTTAQMTTAALMTAVICVLGPIAVPIPMSPVPISLGTLVLYFMGYVLGMKGAVISCLLYLFLGIVGLPVFTGFAGGVGKLMGPTGGYLAGYLFLAGLTGYFVERFPKKRALHMVGMVLGTAVCYGFGTIWISRQLGISFVAGLGVAVIPYLPGDAAKMILAVFAGPVIRRSVSRAAGI